MIIFDFIAVLILIVVCKTLKKEGRAFRNIDSTSNS